jgi:hypothetical protein
VLPRKLDRKNKIDALWVTVIPKIIETKETQKKREKKEKKKRSSSEMAAIP